MEEKLYIVEVIFTGEIEKDSYLHHLPVVKALKERKSLSFHKPVTFFTGENALLSSKKIASS